MRDRQKVKAAACLKLSAPILSEYLQLSGNLLMAGVPENSPFSSRLQRQAAPWPYLMGRLPTLMGRFPDSVLRGRLTFWKSTGKQPISRGFKKLSYQSSVTPLFIGDRKSLQLQRIIRNLPKNKHMETLLSNPSFYQHLGHTKRGVKMAFFVLCFPASGYLGTAKHCETRENAKWQIDPVLPLPQPGSPIICRVSLEHISQNSENSSEKKSRYRPEGFCGKASAIAKMRQKCVSNASQWVLFHWEKRNVPKMRQKCVKIASKMRGTPLRENTFWTIPTIVLRNFFFRILDFLGRAIHGPMPV